VSDLRVHGVGGDAVNFGVELIWLAFALVFMGSFGLGWTMEEIVRGQKRDAPAKKND
jgi:hypothetical protein